MTLVTQDPETKKFKVVVRRGDIERVLHPAHVVFAVGLMSGAPDLPDLPGKVRYTITASIVITTCSSGVQAEFEGNIMHSSQHKTARENIGKKVVVVSAGNSAHDICADHVDYGVGEFFYSVSYSLALTLHSRCGKVVSNLRTSQGDKPVPRLCIKGPRSTS